jgi:hypothetical protein
MPRSIVSMTRGSWVFHPTHGAPAAWVCGSAHTVLPGSAPRNAYVGSSGAGRRTVSGTANTVFSGRRQVLCFDGSAFAVSSWTRKRHVPST